MNEKVFVKPLRSNKAIFFEMPSHSTEGMNYRVRVVPSGEVMCECKGYVFGKRQCIHITDFLKQYNQDRYMLMRDIDTEKLVKENA